MAHEKTWQFAMNQAFGDVSSVHNQGAWWTWFVVQALLGRVPLTDASGAAIASPQGLWTIAGSSDGVTAGMDGVDRWGSTFDATKFVWGANTSAARSWVVLQAPAAFGSYWLTIDLVGTDGEYCILFGAWAAPTGGSTTARPTSTVEQYVGSSGTSPRPWSDTATVVGRHAHLILATDGSFFVLQSIDGSGKFQGYITSHKIMDTKLGDTYPHGVLFSNFATGGAFIGSDLNTNGSTANWSSNNNSGPVGGNLAGLSTPTGSLTFSVFNGGVDTLDNTYNDWPIYFIPSTLRTIKGRFADWRWTHGDPNKDGMVYPLTGTPTDMRVGGTWVPCNQAPSL